MPSQGAETVDAEQAARIKAIEIAEEHNLPNPKLLLATGVPEVQFVIEGAEVVGVYVRNAEPAPIISVVDLDYENDPVKATKKLTTRLDAEGYSRVPFTLDSR